MNRTLHSNATVKTAVLGSGSGSKTGTIIDRMNYRDAIVHIAVANVTGNPDGTEVAVKVQHSETDKASDFVDADIQNIRSSFTATEEQNELHLNLDGFKQYIRIVTDTKFNGGTAAGADIIGTVVLGNMVSNPVRPTHTDPVDGASIGEAVVGDTLIVK